MSKCAMNLEGCYSKRLKKRFVVSNIAIIVSLITAVSLVASDQAAAAYIRKSVGNQAVLAAAENQYRANIDYVDEVSERFSDRMLDKSVLKAVGEIMLSRIDGAETEAINCGPNKLSIQGNSSEYSGIMRYCGFIDECLGVKGNVLIESISLDNKVEYRDYMFLISMDLEMDDSK